ncbi:VWA domain-containing protein [Rhodococcus sp. NPDC056960]|uniref:vWA domain-containing protein n=1 Tax=Rhodococcus sp. NPDC056960 TaxID=3345982 RepID=UPI003628179D
MTSLARGENVEIARSRTSIGVAGARRGEVDLMVFQLGADGRVRSDDDFVFFNNPRSPEGAVHLVAADGVDIDLAAVPADIHKLSIAVALDDSVPGSLADRVGLGVVIDQHSGASLGADAAGLSTERAAVLVEVYRRGAGWKVRNVSAGWDGGLAVLVTEHGVDVSESVPADDVAVRTVPDELGLSFEKRQKLDMRKREVAKVLLHRGAGEVRARVVLVIDKTGSMRRQYSTRAINRVVERMVPVATQIDDDGRLEPYLYAKHFARLPDIAVHEVDTWCETFLHLGGVHGGIDYSAIGGYNDELPIMTDIISNLPPRGGTPTLVLFFTDGGFQQRGKISELMRRASGLPAFWQFVGIGRADYGLLEKLDTLDGRTIDNAGFFAVDDIDTIDDAELYRRLLSEFPDWLRAAKSVGVVG